MKSLKKTLSLLLALCLAVSMAACIPTQTVPTDPSTETTSPTEETSVPTESNPTAPTETISPTTMPQEKPSYRAVERAVRCSSSAPSPETDAKIEKATFDSQN